MQILSSIERVGRKSPSQKQMLNVLKMCCNVLTFMSIYVRKKPQWCRDPGRKWERQQLTHTAIEDKMTFKVQHNHNLVHSGDKNHLMVTAHRSVSSMLLLLGEVQPTHRRAGRSLRTHKKDEVFFCHQFFRTDILLQY